MRKLVALLALVAGSASAADCYISEYSDILQDPNGREVPVAGAPITTQRVTYTTSTQSSAFNARTRFIRIVCDAAAHFAFGANPTATANNPYVPANAPEYFGVTPGQEIAVYDGSS